MKLRGHLKLLLGTELEMTILEKVGDILIVEVKYRGIRQRKEIYQKLKP